MNLKEIEQEALALTEPERAKLVVSLMDTFTATETGVTDEEETLHDPLPIKSE